jgi:hypothetical protein
MKNYFGNNPIARQIALETFKLNENASVDSLLRRATEVTLDTFKKLIFDLAEKSDRNPDALRLKLTDVGSSKTIKNLVAKIKDYADEAGISDSRYSEVKQMYLAALAQIADALKRLVEVDPKLGDMAIDNFQELSTKLVKSLEEIATTYASKMNDSVEHEGEHLNESIFTGYKGRIEKLRKKLVNIISDSKGKDTKSGYGRDWQRMFTALDQKLDAIDTAKDVIGEKDRKNLADLEKQTDNLAQEYYNYKIKATEQVMKKIVDDDELVTKFSDVNELITAALDMIAKANVQEAIIETRIREELEETEAKINEKVFPIKKGANDTDLKYKKSGIIAAVQKSLMDAFPSLAKLLSERGGADGKYGDRTSVAIKAMQGAFGNKNVSGELDKTLLDTILSLDQVSSENKKLINQSLEKLKKAYAVSESTKVLSSSEFMQMNEASLYINDEDLEKEIEKHSEDLANSPVTNSSPKKMSSADSELAKDLAKALRQEGYNKNAEEDNFVREDGTFKASYPVEYVQAWYDTIVANEGKEKKPSFFWLQDEDDEIGALYPTRRLAGNIKKPCNWPKWNEIAKSDAESDVNSFANWYTSVYSNFGGVTDSSRLDTLKKILTFHADSENVDEAPAGLSDEVSRLVSSYDEVRDSLRSAKPEGKDNAYEYFSRGYITPETMKVICDAAKKAAQVGDKDPDLGEYDFMLIANLIALVASCVTYDDKNKKFVPAIDILFRNALTEEVLSRVQQDRSFSAGKKKHKMAKLVSGNGIEIGEQETDAKKVMQNNLKRAKEVHKKLIEQHTSRMNMKNIDDASTQAKASIYVIPE